MIYSELLWTSNCSCEECQTAFPAILRSCSQVHLEAVDNLYAQNTISIDFAISSFCGFEDVTDDMFINGEPVDMPTWPTEGQCIPNVGRMFPTFLRQAQKLSISVTAHHCQHLGPHEDQTQRFVRNRLLTLATFLMDSHKLKYLRIHFHDCASPSESTLYPLRRLRNVPRVEIVGHESKAMAHMAEDTAREMRLCKPALNTVKHYQLLLNEAHEYLNLVRRVYPTLGVDRDDEKTEPNSLYNRIGRLFVRLESAAAKGLFRDKHTKANLQELLRKLRQKLDEVDENVLETRLELFTKAKQRRLRAS